MSRKISAHIDNLLLERIDAEAERRGITRGKLIADTLLLNFPPREVRISKPRKSRNRL